MYNFTHSVYILHIIWYVNLSFRMQVYAVLSWGNFCRAFTHFQVASNCGCVKKVTNMKYECNPLMLDKKQSDFWRCPILVNFSADVLSKCACWLGHHSPVGASVTIHFCPFLTAPAIATSQSSLTNSLLHLCGFSIWKMQIILN